MGDTFSGICQGIENENILEAESVKSMIESGISEMKTISKAGIGDKTMMDALLIAGEYAEKAETDDVGIVLKAAAEGAAEGTKATEKYIAKYGRAKSYGEQTLGFPDAGAVGMMYLFKGLYEGYML